MAAAARVIAKRGLNATTALIAEEAGVSNGSLFTYFETKSELLNQLYVELKGEMAAAVLHGLPADRDVREQMAHVWAGWLGWAASHPDKRRALAQLSVLEEIGPKSREVGGGGRGGGGPRRGRGRAAGAGRACPTPARRHRLRQGSRLRPDLRPHPVRTGLQEEEHHG